MKKYIKPEMDMVETNVEEVICTSDPTIPSGGAQSNVTTEAREREIEDAINDLW